MILHKMCVDFTVLQTSPSSKKLAPKAAMSKSNNDLLRPPIDPPVESTDSVLQTVVDVCEVLAQINC